MPTLGISPESGCKPPVTCRSAGIHVEGSLLAQGIHTADPDWKFNCPSLVASMRSNEQLVKMTRS